MAGATAGVAAVRRRHSVADFVYGAELLPSCRWLQICDNFSCVIWRRKVTIDQNKNITCNN